MSGGATEGTLREWRYGQTQAERMVAALLHLEKFEGVDPQHPLGGPDGLKDVLCRKDGAHWVAAAYFPTTQTTFSVIRAKFVDDAVGVNKNGAAGFAFFLNQNLTVSERQSLIELSPADKTEIYHLERIVGLLNAPKGCGIRLEYLRIAMTEEEQWAFWSTMNEDIVRRLTESENRRDAQLEEIGSKINVILERTRALTADLLARPSSIAITASSVERMDMPTSQLSLSMLCWIHRIVTEVDGVQEAVRGRFRAVQVWIGPAGSTPEDASHIPPPPEQIETLASNLLKWWHQRHAELRGADKVDVAVGLAEFHHRFLSIHPFLDANGRVGRLLLDQAAHELLDQGVGSEFTADPLEYYAALKSADGGDLSPLRQRILASLN